jgi:hypothetical protein
MIHKDFLKERLNVPKHLKICCTCEQQQSSMKPLNRSSIKNNQLVLAFVNFVNSRASFAIKRLCLAYMEDRIGAWLAQSV